MNTAEVMVVTDLFREPASPSWLPLVTLLVDAMVRFSKSVRLPFTASTSSDVSEASHTILHWLAELS